MDLTELTRASRRFLRRLFRRRRHSRLRTFLEIALLSGTVFLLSGFARGETPDTFFADALVWLQEAVREKLAAGWVKPVIADAVVLLLTYGGFFMLLIILAALFRRIPAFIGFLVLCEFHRRQGHNLSALELLIGLSMPIAFTLAIVCKSAVSLYACTHVALCYAYVRASNDPHRIDTILNWYVRIRTAADNSTQDMSDTDDDNDNEDETD